MKKLIIFSLVLFFSFSCKAQSIISLEQAYEYQKIDTVGIPESVTYVKDINNRLDIFVGTWKGSYNGKTYEFRFEKAIKNGGPDIYWDKIFGRLIVKDSNGITVYNDTNVSDEDINLIGLNVQKNGYDMYFGGNVDYCNSGGMVFLTPKKNHPEQLYFLFVRDQEMIDTRLCPNYATFEPILPRELLLTKQ